ncbi:hypothetical protein RCO48_36740 [Peribacillus frigoritolerans]|nr:hypothetical protein [Peribacillus frigoritolerans]
MEIDIENKYILPAPGVYSVEIKKREQSLSWIIYKIWVQQEE